MAGSAAPLTVWVKRLDVPGAEYTALEGVNNGQTVDALKKRCAELLLVGDVSASSLALLLACADGPATAAQESAAVSLNPRNTVAAAGIYSEASLLLRLLAAPPDRSPADLFSFPGAVPADRAARGEHGEKVVVAYMSWLGYKGVRTLPTGADGGADVVATSNADAAAGGDAIAESKAWEGSVGEATLRKFTGAVAPGGKWHKYADKDKLYFAGGYAASSNPNGQTVLQTASGAGVSLFRFVEGVGRMTVEPFNDHARALVARLSAARSGSAPATKRARATRSEDFVEWSREDVQTWLEELKLEELCSTFKAYDGHLLAGLTGGKVFAKMMMSDKRHTASYSAMKAGLARLVAAKALRDAESVLLLSSGRSQNVRSIATAMGVCLPGQRHSPDRRLRCALYVLRKVPW